MASRKLPFGRTTRTERLDMSDREDRMISAVLPLTKGSALRALSSLTRLTFLSQSSTAITIRQRLFYEEVRCENYAFRLRSLRDPTVYRCCCTDRNHAATGERQQGNSAHP